MPRAEPRRSAAAPAPHQQIHIVNSPVPVTSSQRVIADGAENFLCMKRVLRNGGLDGLTDSAKNVWYALLIQAEPIKIEDLDWAAAVRAAQTAGAAPGRGLSDRRLVLPPESPSKRESTKPRPSAGCARCASGRLIFPTVPDETVRTQRDGFYYLIPTPLPKDRLNERTPADAAVLAMPCGHSAHLEAGWFAGVGRPAYVFYPDALCQASTGADRSGADVSPVLGRVPGHHRAAGGLRKLPWSFSARQQRFTPRLAAALDRIDVLREQLGASAAKASPNPGRRKNKEADMSLASPVPHCRNSHRPHRTTAARARSPTSASWPPRWRSWTARRSAARRGIPNYLPACRLILMRAARQDAAQQRGERGGGIASRISNVTDGKRISRERKARRARRSARQHRAQRRGGHQPSARDRRGAMQSLCLRRFADSGQLRGLRAKYQCILMWMIHFSAPLDLEEKPHWKQHLLPKLAAAGPGGGILCIDASVRRIHAQVGIPASNVSRSPSDAAAAPAMSPPCPPVRRNGRPMGCTTSSPSPCRGPG